MESRALGYWKFVMIWIMLLAGMYAFWKWWVGFLLPFVFAILLAGSLQPLSRYLIRLGFPRTAAVLCSLLVGVGASVAIAGALIIVVVVELLRILHMLPQYLSGWQTFIAHQLGNIGHLGQLLGVTPSDVRGQLGTVYRVAESLVRSILSIVVTLPDAVLVFVLALVAAFFMMRDSDVVFSGLRKLLPPPFQGHAGRVRRDIFAGTLGLVKAQLVLVGSTAVITTAGLMVVGKSYAALIGLLAGILDLVPFLGPTVILLPWASADLFLGHLIAAIQLTVVLGIVGISRQLLEPRLVGSQTGLHPLVVLFSLYMGIRLFGGVGVVAGPVSAITLKAVAKALSRPPLPPPGRTL